MVGRKLTDEQKMAVSRAQKGRKHLPQQGFQKGHGLLGNNPTSKGKNWKLTEENKLNISLAKQGDKNPMYGKTILPQTLEALVKKNKGNKYCLGRKATKESIEKRRLSISGPKHFAWIADRTLLVKSDKKHLDGRYRDWMKAVKNRDGWTCRIADDNCNGRLEAHHILRWSKHPELRYEVNNGITLCAFHHPLKINDEERLAPLFTDLVLTVK